MNFKTKDLLVTVLPKVPDPKACLLHSIVCRFPTFVCVQPCSFLPTCFRWQSVICPGLTVVCPHGTIVCPGGSIVCPGGSGDPFVIQYLEDLVALRAELQETLRQLDAIQKEGLPSAISSKAEADALEQSLNEALKQVKAAQAKFRRG